MLLSLYYQAEKKKSLQTQAPLVSRGASQSCGFDSKEPVSNQIPAHGVNSLYSEKLLAKASYEQTWM